MTWQLYIQVEQMKERQNTQWGQNKNSFWLVFDVTILLSEKKKK